MPFEPDQPELLDADQGSREYWGNEAAGCIFIARDTGRILLAHRSNRTEYEPDTWGTWGGKVDAGESPKDAVEREVEEETGFNGRYKIHFLYAYRDGEFLYHNYLIIVPFEFSPQLNWENQGSAWVDYGQWPEPLHFGMEYLIKHAGSKIKRVIDLVNKKRENLNEAMDIPPAIIQPAPSTLASNTLDAKKVADAYVVVATLWGESRGEGTEGMQAVMNVIMHRAKDDFSKAKNVVLSPKQFSIWNSVKNPEKSAAVLAQLQRQGKGLDSKQYQEAIQIVDRAMKGTLPDITGGALFYFNPKKANPSWAKKMEKTVSIGNHDFYKPSPKKKSASPLALASRVAASIAAGPKPMKENIDIQPQGLIDINTQGYKWVTPYGYLAFGYDKTSNIFHLLMVQTKKEYQNRGYSKELLNKFFKFMKEKKGRLNPGSYTMSGMAWVKHILERFSKEFGVPLINVRHPQDV